MGASTDADLDVNPPRKDGGVLHKRVKLAILSAGVDFGVQAIEEGQVEIATGIRPREPGGVHRKVTLALTPAAIMSRAGTRYRHASDPAQRTSFACDPQPGRGPAVSGGHSVLLSSRRLQYDVRHGMRCRRPSGRRSPLPFTATI